MCLSREGATRAGRGSLRGPRGLPRPFPPSGFGEAEENGSRRRARGAGRGGGGGNGRRRGAGAPAPAGEKGVATRGGRRRRRRGRPRPERAAGRGIRAEAAPVETELGARAAHKERGGRGDLATCAAAPSAPAGAAFSGRSIGISCATAAAAVGGDLDRSLWTIGERSAGSQQPAPGGGSPPPFPAPRCRGRPGLAALRARGAAGPGCERGAGQPGGGGRGQGERRAGTGAAGAGAGPRREGGRSGRASPGGGASAGESDRPPKGRKVARGRRGPPGLRRSRCASPWHARWKVFKAAKARPRSRGLPFSGGRAPAPPRPTSPRAGTGRSPRRRGRLLSAPARPKSVKASRGPGEQVSAEDLPSPSTAGAPGRRQ